MGNFKSIIGTSLCRTHPLYRLPLHNGSSNHLLPIMQVITDKQYGVKPNHSCKTQLLNVVEEI